LVPRRRTSSTRTRCSSTSRTRACARARAADALRDELVEAERAACDAIGALLVRDLRRAETLAPVGELGTAGATESAAPGAWGGPSAVAAAESGGGGGGSGGDAPSGARVSDAMKGVVATLDDYVNDLRSMLHECARRAPRLLHRLLRLSTPFLFARIRASRLQLAPRDSPRRADAFRSGSGGLRTRARAITRSGDAGAAPRRDDSHAALSLRRRYFFSKAVSALQADAVSAYLLELERKARAQQSKGTGLFQRAQRGGGEANGGAAGSAASGDKEPRGKKKAEAARAAAHAVDAAEASARLCARLAVQLRADAVCARAARARATTTSSTTRSRPARAAPTRAPRAPRARRRTAGCGRSTTSPR
jgi:hypothetical protein